MEIRSPRLLGPGLNTLSGSSGSQAEAAAALAVEHGPDPAGGRSPRVLMVVESCEGGVGRHVFDLVTDVGDSAAIVAPTGRVVPTRDPGALARAWQSLLELAPERRGARGGRPRPHRAASQPGRHRRCATRPCTTRSPPPGPARRVAALSATWDVSHDGTT